MRIDSNVNSSAQTYGFSPSAQDLSVAQNAPLGALREKSANTENTSQKQPGAPASNTQTLTPEEEKQLNALKTTDRTVRTHEQAHIAAGGELVIGGASYSYQTGANNQRYAVGGEVSIDVSPGRTPQETLIKAQRIQAAALAPADPSPQDRNVAAQAARMASEAAMALASEKNAPQSTQKNAQKIHATQSIAAYQQAAEGFDARRNISASVNTFA